MTSSIFFKAFFSILKLLIYIRERLVYTILFLVSVFDLKLAVLLGSILDFNVSFFVFDGLIIDFIVANLTQDL